MRRSDMITVNGHRKKPTVDMKRYAVEDLFEKKMLLGQATWFFE